MRRAHDSRVTCARRTVRITCARRTLRGGVVAALALVLACLSAPAVADTDTELRVKAAFLFNFAKFVNWPEHKFASPASPINLCVPEDDPMGAVLEEMVRGKQIELRGLAVRRATTAADWSRCHIAFVGAGDAMQAVDAFRGLADSSVLTVHESGQSLRGGVIRFFVEDRRMRFEINSAAAERATLQLSAKLMNVAVVVRE